MAFGGADPSATQRECWIGASGLTGREIADYLRLSTSLGTPWKPRPISRSGFAPPAAPRSSWGSIYSLGEWPGNGVAVVGGRAHSEVAAGEVIGDIGRDQQEVVRADGSQ